MIRAVIFDFNGVLVDDEQVHFELFRDVLAEQGITLSEQQYHEVYLGFDDRRCFTEALQDAGQANDSERVDALIARKAERYIERADQGLRYFPGGAECLAKLADRWPLAINSGALRPEIEHALDKLEVRDRVSAIISAEVATRSKPDPQGYLMALEALRASHGEGLEAERCVVFEDSLAGIQSGKAAGMRTIGVSNTYDEAQLREAGAEAVVATLEGLGPETVLELLSQEVTS